MPSSLRKVKTRQRIKQNRLCSSTKTSAEKKQDSALSCSTSNRLSVSMRPAPNSWTRNPAGTNQHRRLASTSHCWMSLSTWISTYSLAKKHLRNSALLIVSRSSLSKSKINRSQPNKSLTIGLRGTCLSAKIPMPSSSTRFARKKYWKRSHGLVSIIRRWANRRSKSFQSPS